MMPGRGLLTIYPPKGGEGDGKHDRGRVGKRVRRIVLAQRKVGNMGNLGRKTGYIHRAELVKSGRVQNLGGITYENIDERGGLHIAVLTKGNKEKEGGRREGELNYQGG